MSYSDPLGDMLTRIRNAYMAGKETLCSPASKLRMCVLDVLKDEGYIRGYSTREVRQNIQELVIELKYHEMKPVIQLIERVSKPGRRIYRRMVDVPHVSNGMGIAILSTSKGVMSDARAREACVGGEVLCYVY